MAISKDVLNQYRDMQIEIGETKRKISWLEDCITKIEKRIADIEAGEVVKDKVRGGLGGIQSFTIEGVPTREYRKKKIELYMKKDLLEHRKATLKSLELNIVSEISDVEEFISNIKDSHIRRIVTLRIVDGLSWNEVADKIGGNTEGSVKMAYQRYMENVK